MINLLIYLLVVYGATNIVSRERVFEWFRESLREYDKIYELFTCPTCLAFWVGIFFNFMIPLNWFLCGLMTSGVVNIIENIKNKF